METGAPVGVRGDAEDLRVLLSNLVDNAIRYTPAGGRVDVTMQREDGEAVIEVTDTGPGIPAGERVFDRFYRASGTSEPSSGLGLAIVRAIVDQHGGTITLDDARGSGGLRVRVRLPFGNGNAPPLERRRAACETILTASECDSSLTGSLFPYQQDFSTPIRFLRSRAGRALNQPLIEPIRRLLQQGKSRVVCLRRQWQP